MEPLPLVKIISATNIVSLNSVQVNVSSTNKVNHHDITEMWC